MVAFPCMGGREHDTLSVTGNSQRRDGDESYYIPIVSGC